MSIQKIAVLGGGAWGTALALTCADRKSTRLNSIHLGISYAVFCLKKKKRRNNTVQNAKHEPKAGERTDAPGDSERSEQSETDGAAPAPPQATAGRELIAPSHHHS